MKTFILTLNGLIVCWSIHAQLIDPFVDGKAIKQATAPRYSSDNATSTTYLFNETDPIGYDLFAANLSFTDKNQTQKFGFSPFRLSNRYRFLISNFRLN